MKDKQSNYQQESGSSAVVGKMGQFLKEIEAYHEQDKRQAIAEELESLLETVSKGDIGIAGAYETDIVPGYLLKDRINQLKGQDHED